MGYEALPLIKAALFELDFSGAQFAVKFTMPFNAIKFFPPMFLICFSSSTAPFFVADTSKSLSLKSQ